MKKNLFALFMGAIFLMTFNFTASWAGEVDILINKLVEKGVLSHSEATQLLEEMQAEGKRQKEEITQVATAAAVEEARAGVGKLAGWVNKMKIKGDLRLRYQNEDTEDDNKAGRNRGRFRLRLGVESQVNDRWKVGLGLASGGDDPRSTNQTLQNTFDSPDVRIDYAYAKYTPFKSLSLAGGKIKNPIWKPKDLLWDSDIRPEGLAINAKHKLSPGLELFFTPAFFILEEYKADANDPWMFVVQQGLKWKINDSVALKLAGAYYGFDELEGNNFGWSEGTNSTDGAGNLIYDYDSFALGGELGVKLQGPVPHFAIFGEYVSSDADDDDTGYLAGFKFGHKKVKKFRQWQAKYNYRRLERDAWPDFLQDSDFYGGGTNVKGHEIEFKFGLAKYVTLGFDYYKSEMIDHAPGASEEEEDLLQVDLVLKW